jgi:hypothetical protein
VWVASRPIAGGGVSLSWCAARAPFMSRDGLRCGRTIRSRKNDHRAEEWGAWESAASERKLMRAVVYAMVLVLTLLTAFFNLIYGVKFSASQNKAWMTSVLLGVFTGACAIPFRACVQHACRRFLLLTVRLSFVVADVVLMEPIAVLVTTCVRFFLAVNKRDVLHVIYEPLMAAYGPNLLHDYENMDSPKGRLYAVKHDVDDDDAGDDGGGAGA